MSWASAQSLLPLTLFSSCKSVLSSLPTSLSTFIQPSLHPEAKRNRFSHENPITSLFYLILKWAPRSSNAVCLSLFYASISMPAPSHSMCQTYPAPSYTGIPQTSSCQQEVTLSLLFSLRWTPSQNPLCLPAESGLPGQLLLILDAYLPHPRLLKSKYLSHSFRALILSSYHKA